VRKSGVFILASVALMALVVVQVTGGERDPGVSSAEFEPGDYDDFDISDIDPSDTAMFLDEPLLDDEFSLRVWVEHERLLLDGIRRHSYGRVNPPAKGEAGLAEMSPLEVDRYLAKLRDVLDPLRDETFESAQQVLAAHRRDWPRQPCPGGGPIDRSLFDSDLAETIGLDSFDDIPGFEVDFVADISLPDGVVYMSSASFDPIWPVDLGRPGVHPFFAATALSEDREYVSFAQLVIAPGVPTRWEPDDRFLLDAEYSQLWIAGASSHPGHVFDSDDLIEDLAYWDYVQELIDEAQSPCEHWAHRDGRNVVRQDTSFDGTFPAYVGYDEGGRVLAVTWDFGEDFRTQETTPGSEAPTPTPVPSNNGGPTIDTDL